MILKEWIGLITGIGDMLFEQRLTMFSIGSRGVLCKQLERIRASGVSLSDPYLRIDHALFNIPPLPCHPWLTLLMPISVVDDIRLTVFAI